MSVGGDEVKGAGIIIRRLSSREEFEEFGRVEMSVWGGQYPPPPELLRAIADNGGLVLGAFQGEKMIGILLSFTGFNGGRIYHYSHQAGVLAEYRDKGVGFMLKMTQRSEVIKMGLDLIIWTFNPLMARNAFFNVGKLGAIVRCYMRNYYGLMNDELNRGIPTDRVIAEWWINNKRVNGWRPIKVSDPLQYPQVIATVPVEGGPYRLPVHVIKPTSDPLMLEMPADLLSLRDALGESAVNAWINAYRDAFDFLLGENYHATDVVSSNGRVFYVFTRSDEDLGQSICNMAHGKEATRLDD
jgi:predicted GNAT superfamily acetyltransferase